MLCSLVAVLALSQAPTPDFTAETAPEGLRLVESTEAGVRELALLRVGPLKDLLRHGNVIYVAPVAGGLIAVDATQPTAPVITARLLAGKAVVRIGHEGEGFLVLTLADRSAVALSVADAFHPAEAQFHSVEVKSVAASGKVLSVKNGWAVIEGGSNVGFAVGDHVKIFAHAQLSAVEELAAQQGLSPPRQVSAIVALTSVDATLSLAQLGRGEGATVGDAVEATSDSITETIFIPRTVPFTWRLEAALRPFAALNNSVAAVGMLFDLRAQYYFSSVPLRLEVGLEPLGLVIGGREQHNPSLVVADVAFTSTYVEVGIGAGFSTLANEDLCAPLVPCSGNQQVDALFPVLTGRFGTLDGLNLAVTYAIGWTRNSFDFDREFEATLNAPLSRRLTLYFETGIATGFSYGEVGMRTYVNGLGGPGTVILSGGVGGAGINDGLSEHPAGVALSLGVETRL